MTVDVVVPIEIEETTGRVGPALAVAAEAVGEHVPVVVVDISVEIDLDGTGRYDNRTGVGFFDHMLDQLAAHVEGDVDDFQGLNFQYPEFNGRPLNDRASSIWVPAAWTVFRLALAAWKSIRDIVYLFLQTAAVVDMTTW